MNSTQRITAVFAATGLEALAQMAFTGLWRAGQPGLRPDDQLVNMTTVMEGRFRKCNIRIILVVLVLTSALISCGEDSCECPTPNPIEYTSVVFYYKDHPYCYSSTAGLEVELYVGDELIGYWHYGSNPADPNLDYPNSQPFPVELGSALNLEFRYWDKSGHEMRDTANLIMDDEDCTYVSFFADIENPCLGAELCDSCIVFEIDENMKCEGADSIYVAVVTN